MTTTEKQEIKSMINEVIKPFQDMMKSYFNLFEITKGFTLPFDVSIPNETTLKAMQDADTGTNLTSYDSFDEMIKDLHSQCMK